MWIIVHDAWRCNIHLEKYICPRNLTAILAIRPGNTGNDRYSGKNGQGFLFHYSGRFHYSDRLL